VQIKANIVKIKRGLIVLNNSHVINTAKCILRKIWFLANSDIVYTWIVIYRHWIANTWWTNLVKKHAISNHSQRCQHIYHERNTPISMMRKVEA